MSNFLTLRNLCKFYCTILRCGFILVLIQGDLCYAFERNNLNCDIRTLINVRNSSSYTHTQNSDNSTRLDKTGIRLHWIEQQYLSLSVHMNLSLHFLFLTLSSYGGIFVVNSILPITLRYNLTEWIIHMRRVSVSDCSISFSVVSMTLYSDSDHVQSPPTHHQVELGVSLPLNSWRPNV